MNDSDVVDAFVLHLQSHGYPGLTVERRPDKENRNSTDIDAIAGSLAIEHTSVDALQDQRQYDDWFMRAAGGLEQEFTGDFPFRLNVTLEYSAVAKGQDWSAIRAALKRWVTRDAAALPDGTHHSRAPGVPFLLRVTKSSGNPPGLFLSRSQPDDETLSERVRAKFDEKAAKLAKYQPEGKNTVLLVENTDIALMSKAKLIEAIRLAYPTSPPSGVNQVWYADTSIPTAIQFHDFTPKPGKSAT